MSVKGSRSTRSSRAGREVRRDAPKSRSPRVSGDMPHETVELMRESTTPPRGATETLVGLLSAAEAGGTAVRVSSAAAVHEALERVEEARDALEHADEELRILALHGEAALAFAETLSEVLGDRPLSVENARRAAFIAAASTVWEGAVGPLLTGEQVRALMGISRQRVAQLAGERHVIVLEEQSGARRYPAWQFGPSGRPLTALVAAHRTLVEDGHMSGWSAASWCVHEHPELGGRSPREWATAGEDSDRLALVARRDADRAAQ